MRVTEEEAKEKRVTAVEAAISAERFCRPEQIIQAQKEYYEAIDPYVKQLGKLYNAQPVRYVLVDGEAPQIEVIWDAKCKAAYDGCIEIIQEIHRRIFGPPTHT